MSITGGCQCGAVRYRIDGEFGEVSVCHCRMCQKATGGFFGPYAGGKPDQLRLVWTRGERKRFQSSNKVWRGFCEACGTPLTFEHVSGAASVTIGSLDDPAAAPPTLQLGSHQKLPWVGDVASLEEMDADDPRIVAYQAELVSFQHPDHDT